MEDPRTQSTSGLDPCCQRTPLATAPLSATLTAGAQCLATLPHDPKLVPANPTDVSLIPPVNQSSSFYDGMQSPSAGCLRMLIHLV